MNNKKFTLIELIVVIAVLGILASLIVPNISSFKGDATVTAIASNVRNFQTSVDMYSLKNNGQYPTANQPTEFTPEPIDFTKLDKTYLKTFPKTDGVKYWVDFQGRVWASTVDAPRDVLNDGGNISWTPVTGAVKYQVFEVQGYGGLVGALSKNKSNLILKGETTTTSLTGEANKYYVVNSLDAHSFESAPAGLNYQGYVEPIQQSEGGTQSPTPINHKPVATITMNQEQGLTTITNITFNYTFADEDNDTISQVEWQKNAEAIQTNVPNGTFTEGNHTIKLRVQDSKGLWSDWVEKKFTINSIKIGQRLIAPEPNWRRYEETHNGFTYSGSNWLAYNHIDFSNGTIKYTNALNSKIDFSFKGTRLRVIGQNHTDGNTNIEIYIDGVKEIFSQYTTNITDTTQRVNYEKFGLSDTIHNVSIINKATNSFLFRFDAIDIDNTGELLTPNYAPVPIITMTPTPDVNNTLLLNDFSNIVWSYTYTDANGDTIQNVEWQDNPSNYTASGIYTTKLRVQDSQGLWSDWVSKTTDVRRFAGKQIPQGTIYSASTVYNTGVASNIGDGEVKGWTATSNTGYVDMTFPTPQTVSGIGFLSTQTTAGNVDFEIYSYVNNSWTLVGTKTVYIESYQVGKSTLSSFTFPQSTFNKMRVKITSSNGSWVGLNEVTLITP